MSDPIAIILQAGGLCFLLAFAGWALYYAVGFTVNAFPSSRVPPWVAQRLMQDPPGNYGIPPIGPPTKLNPVINISVKVPPREIREKREFRFRQYSQFHGEEVLYWYRRDVESGEVIGAHVVTVREFWGKCYDE